MINFTPFYSFHVGPVTLYAHGLLIGAGVIAAYYYMQRDSNNGAVKIKAAHLLDYVVLWGFLGGFLGARILYVALNIHLYKSVAEVFSIWEGGLVSFGGMIGGAITAALYLRYKKQSFIEWADFVTPYMLLGWAIGRLGSLVTWGTIGTPSELPWALKVGEDVARHPTQGYHTIALLLLFFLLLYVRKTTTNWKGKMTALAMAAYGLQRFLLEFVRGYPDNEYPFFYRNFAQLVSLALFIAGIALYMYTKKKAATKADNT